MGNNSKLVEVVFKGERRAIYRNRTELDVSEGQWVVVEAERDDVCGRGVDRVGQQGEHGVIDLTPVLGYLGAAGTADDSSLGSLIARPDADVVRVEQLRVRLIDRLVPRIGCAEHEGLEEPGGVGTVPLHGADVGHRLDRLVLRGEWSGQLLGVGAD